MKFPSNVGWLNERSWLLFHEISFNICLYVSVYFLFHLSEHFGVLNLFYITRDNHEYW